MPCSTPRLKLHSGGSIPVFGLGTWNSPPGEVRTAVSAALSLGYRHIDCAAIYGNESEVGEALQEASVPRDEIFITSKLWNTAHRASDVEPACRETLAYLGLDYLDLYLVHFPVSLRPGAKFPPKADDFIDVPVMETWRAMEALVEKGLVRAIGLSNFSVSKIKEVMGFASVKPSVVQVEAHPYLPQKELQSFCESHGIVLTAYSPLGSPSRPPVLYEKSDPILLEDQTLADVAKRVGSTPADVLIKWAVQRGWVVIPKSVTPSRIESNFRAISVPLPAEEMGTLTKIETRCRFLKCDLFFPVDTCGPIKSYQDLWDEEP